MEVGDRTAGAAVDLDPPPAAVPAAVAKAEAEAEAEPLTVVQEGWSGEGITFFVLALGMTSAAAYIGLQAFGLRTPGAVWGALGCIGLGGAAAAKLLLRPMLRWRREITMDAEGLSIWESHPDFPEREWTRIAWTDIHVFNASVRPAVASLIAVSGARRVVQVKESPPRPEMAELIRRFEAQANRYPRVPEPPRPPAERRGDPLLGLRTLGYAAAGGGLIWVGIAMQGRLRLPAALQVPVLLGAGALYFGVRLLLRLHDPATAEVDRDSRRWTARARNRLRAWFGIRHL
jgi:hypothetical protein